MHVKTEENVHDLEWSKEIQKQKNCIKLDDVGLSHSRGRENIYIYVCVSISCRRSRRNKKKWKPSNSKVMMHREERKI